MKVVLVDYDWPDPWAFNGNRFRNLAGVLTQAGHDVMLLNVRSTASAPADDGAVLVQLNGRPPVLTGLNRALGAGPLIHAYRLAERLVGEEVDLVLCPLLGGLAHGLLMDRACAQGLSTTRIALWCDGLSRTHIAEDDDAQMAMAILVADALERQCLAMADALVGPWQSLDVGFLPPSVLVPRLEASLPLEPASAAAHVDAAGVQEIVFVGPLNRSAGVADFIYAVERLAAERRLRVLFAGPERRSPSGRDKEWLGLRARSWRFPFRVVDCPSLATAKALVSRRNQLGFTMMNEHRRPQYFCCDGPIEVGVAVEGERLPQRIEAELAAILRGDAALRSSVMGPNWPELIERIRGQPTRPPVLPVPAVGATVCILHFNRPEKLAHALASVPLSTPESPIELIVIDNASTLVGIETRLSGMIAGRADTRLLRLDEALPQAAAYNHGLAAASHEVVIFLDDDNVFQTDGVERLATGLRHGGFDILVTNLEVFEEQSAEPTPTVARLAFLGAAHSAGLFFNGFGDTAMAVRRKAFGRIGGFHDPGRDYPCLDWVTLAGAQARGLRIGVLQRPAVRYRRSTHASGISAHKLNQEEARLLVLSAYTGSIDAELVARYAQYLHVGGA